jgi:hypothetical protein
MRAGDKKPMSLANRFSFVLDARAERREPGIIRRLKDEGIREAAHHRRAMRRRIERKAVK